MATKAQLEKRYAAFQTKFDALPQYDDAPTLLDFLATKKCLKVLGGKYVLDCGASEGGSNEVKDAITATGSVNRQYVLKIGKNIIHTNPFIPKCEDHAVCFVYMNDKPVVLQDGDEDASSTILDLDGEIHPTISYHCLARLMGTAEKPVARKAVINALASGRMKVLDYSPDTYLAKKPKNTAGFTKRGTGWHRSATVLFRYKNETWLIGQDDTYFGVVLSDHPKTLADAFISLQHPRVRGVKNVFRQGEWFISPVKESEVPSDDYVSTTQMTLPKEVDGNPHELYCYAYGDAVGEIRIKDGRMFARSFRITHPQHCELVCYNLPGWYEILKNTAVRAVSVEGVD